jgi:glucokinase
MTALAIDIGGTKIAGGRVADDGTIVGPVRTVPTPAAAGGPAVVAAVGDLALELLDADVRAVGVSSAGVIDTGRGLVIGATSSITNWAGTAVGPALGERLSLPVTVVGDGHAFALGEARYGAGRGFESALVIAAGTGIGGSYIRAGQPLTGAHWAGGHIGHVPVAQAQDVPCPCGSRGHVEAVAGGPGIVALFHRFGGDKRVRRVEELPLDHPLGRLAVQTAGRALGAAAGGLTNALDPAVVVVAGGLTQLGPLWEAALRDEFGCNLIGSLRGRVPLLVSAAGSEMALRGAAYATKGT